MAKDWAYGFYHSTAWTQTRETYIRSQHGLCQWCGGIGDTVHHDPPLTPRTINDPIMTLGFDHLVLLCRDCHALAHATVKPCAAGAHFDADGNLVADHPPGGS